MALSNFDFSIKEKTINRTSALLYDIFLSFLYTSYPTVFLKPKRTALPSTVFLTVSKTAEIKS